MHINPIINFCHKNTPYADSRINNQISQQVSFKSGFGWFALDDEDGLNWSNGWGPFAYKPEPKKDVDWAWGPSSSDHEDSFSRQAAERKQCTCDDIECEEPECEVYPEDFPDDYPTDYLD